MLEQQEATLAVPGVSSLISYRSRTKRTPFTVSGTQSMGGKDPCPAHGKQSLTEHPLHQSLCIMLLPLIPYRTCMPSRPPLNMHALLSKYST